MTCRVSKLVNSRWAGFNLSSQSTRYDGVDESYDTALTEVDSNSDSDADASANADSDSGIQYRRLQC